MLLDSFVPAFKFWPESKTGNSVAVTACRLQTTSHPNTATAVSGYRSSVHGKRGFAGMSSLVAPQLTAFPSG